MGCLVLHNLTYTQWEQEWQCFRHHHSLFITPPTPNPLPACSLHCTKAKSHMRQPAKSTRSIHSKRRIGRMEGRESKRWQERGKRRRRKGVKQSDCSTGLGLDRRRSSIVLVYHSNFSHTSTPISWLWYSFHCLWHKKFVYICMYICIYICVCIYI